MKRLISVLLLILPMTASASPLSPAMKTAQAIRRVPQDDPGWRPMPEAIVRLLPKFKRALRDDALEALETTGSLTEAESKLRERWRKQGLLARHSEESENAESSEVSDWDFSHLESVDFKEVPDHPTLVSIRVALAIPNGNDTSLYFFDRTKKAVVWTWDKRGYYDSAGAGWALDYRVTPKAADGRWYVVIAHMTPWPSSSMRGLRLEVHEPSRGPVTKPLHRYEDSIWYGGDPFELAVKGDQFGISYHARSPDLSVLYFRRSVWWRVAQGHVARTPPVGTDPVPFLEYWVQSDWKEASRFISDSARTELQRAHRTLQPHAQTSVWMMVEPGCDLSAGKNAVTVGIADDRGPDGYAVYLVVTQTPQFHIEAIHPSREGLCHDLSD